MKKLGLFLLVACLAIGTAFAQKEEKSRTPPETITVEGTLQLQNGMISVLSGETSFLVPMLNRYIGFIEGLKEGNKISVEGYARKNFLHPSKVIIAGKSYDFPAMVFSRRSGPGTEPRQGEQPRQMFGQGNKERFGQRLEGHHKNRPPRRHGHENHKKEHHGRARGK